MSNADYIFVSFLSDLIPRTDLQCGSLQKKGYKVAGMIWKSGKNLHSSSCVDKIEIHTPISDFMSGKLPKIVTIPFLYLEYLFRIRSRIALIKKHDVVFILTHPFLLLILPTMKKKYRIYLDVAEFYSIMFSYMGFFGKIMSNFLYLIENRYIPKLKGVFCVTSKNGWLKRRLSALNSNTIELWNLPSIYQKIDIELDCELKAANLENPSITYIGGLKPSKGLEIFPKVVKSTIKKCPNAKFIIIGNINCGTHPNLWFQRQAISQYCTHINWCSQKAVNSYLKHSSVGLVLSNPSGIHLHVGAGNGRKLFTYMAAGLPVIAPSHSEAWNIVTDSFIGLQVNIENPDDIANAIVDLLQNEKKRLEMGSKAKMLFLNCLNWEFQEERFLEFLTSI